MGILSLGILGESRRAVVRCDGIKLYIRHQNRVWPGVGRDACRRFCLFRWFMKHGGDTKHNNSRARPSQPPTVLAKIEQRAGDVTCNHAYPATHLAHPPPRLPYQTSSCLFYPLSLSFSLSLSLSLSLSRPFCYNATTNSLCAVLCIFIRRRNSPAINSSQPYQRYM